MANELRFILIFKQTKWVEANFDELTFYGNEMHANFIENSIEVQHAGYDNLIKELDEKYHLKQDEHYTIKNKVYMDEK